ncbi:cobalt ECF transporter T component CbiQ [Desulfurobacterium atlanticum]|uniref:Cobalt/nickel transport system permease protein n=1 Tax=Desulfurobacterium atlanticum TaxID=240169 RepID=A0A238XUE4_9BACT|nr:cobalt ECF transporter T component CbiQ [Desulfurobacterium atlanticum]SNR62332.1 cobalt/nickel transport system permease protein [Desulfurobacterium atlanticum]
METKFSNGVSLLHRIDARTKVLICLLFSFVCALSSSISFLGMIGLFLMFLILVFLRKNLKDIFYTLLFADSFLFFIIITTTLTFNKGKLIKVGVFPLYIEGLKYGAFLFFKSNIILLTVIVFLSTSTIFEIAHALHHLKVPSKLVQMLFFTFRYLQVIKDEYNRLLKAAKARGFKPKTNIHTYKTYGYIVANLLIRSYLKSDRIYKAMLCRGFKGEFPVYKHFKLKKEDILFATISVAYFLLAFTWSEIWRF